MEFLDICFDLETCSRSANAAVVSIAATVFDRYGEKPFPEIRHATFQKSVDLRWCLIDGFDFDPQTCKWWSEQSSEAKGSLVDGEPEPLESAVLMFFAWINEQKCMNKIDGNNVRLWCQGTDFDAAILRTICRKYDIKMPFSYYDFRDARTFVKEGLQGYSNGIAPLAYESELSIMEKIIRTHGNGITIERTAHDPLSDCQYSAFQVWCVMRMQRAAR